MMGTNFYWRDSPCDKCSRYERIHVGKQSGGWSFAFHTYPNELLSDDNPEWGHVRTSPFGHPVMSRADWRRVFTERPGKLLDEYDCHVEDPVGWLDGRVAPDAEQIATEEAMYHGYDPPRVRDAEGFRVIDQEFS